ncbi:hypothetical protein BOTBODRAFT_405357 [Botryobasidium botryosum FD-172 SS1]|uniref:Uncharacterized protein n=1 Tax=Botryobasidium botryosum (strain FD-172 SS1) TaxID=930990 RepID=A0A067MM31_BOTB1|nr:hypothetical protein BOTBODRAFT_405357 [Botryobasidium botryosum FD-172 SS1]
MVLFTFYLEQSLFVGPYRERAAHATQTSYYIPSDPAILNITSLTVVIKFQEHLLLSGVRPHDAVNITALWPRHPLISESVAGGSTILMFRCRPCPKNVFLLTRARKGIIMDTIFYPSYKITCSISRPLIYCYKHPMPHMRPYATHMKY